MKPELKYKQYKEGDACCSPGGTRQIDTWNVGLSVVPEDISLQFLSLQYSRNFITSVIDTCSCYEVVKFTGVAIEDSLRFCCNNIPKSSVSINKQENVLKMVHCDKNRDLSHSFL